jgi:predicted ATPase/class 3 adenylate cyclase
MRHIVSEVIIERKPLPSGTVTFLFTDIEGSTERWERHRESMKTAVRQHEEVIREAVATHDGYVFKTIGDAFCASFFNVADAIAAALDAQRALTKEDWSNVEGLKVRMAIHTGHTEERQGDYFGPTVNRVARLLAIGHGGQILVSGASADLSQGELPPQAALRDLGAHRLKDLTHPEQVYQLVAPDLQPEFPPLRSLEALPHNLPLQITSFVGRELELLTVSETLNKYRLVTLVGAGGVGKTRLALQVGADLLDRYEDGVWLVELAPITDASLVPSSLASIFHVQQVENRTVTEALLHALKPRRTLIIFDNCEHVVEAAARLIDAILRNCPHIRIIATTRQGLGIAGEAVHRVASLAVPVPETQKDLTAEQAMQHGAVALFVERATAATESFRLTDQNASVVARVCQRLDGIALAIELAAPRLKALSVEQLETKLNERFRILTGGSRTALPRQQTMRALVDWSYELLTDDEKTLFRRAAVFGGSWTLDAASAICADEQLEEWTILDLMQSLVDKSMVVAKLSGSEQRYRLLESTRQYAQELLEKSGELEPMQTRHAAWYFQLVTKADSMYWSMPTKAWVALLEPDNDNLRAVLDWALGLKRDIELGAAMAAKLGNYWRLTSYEAEGRARIDAGVALSSEIISKKTIAELWLGRRMLEGASAANWERLGEVSERAFELCKELGDETGMVLAGLGIAERHLRQFNHDEAGTHIDAALALAEKTGNRRLMANVKATMARNLHFAGKTEEARRYYAEALGIARAQGDDRLRSIIVGNLAEVEFAQGDATRALELGREASEIVGASQYIPFNNLAAYLLSLDRAEEARVAARTALRNSRDAQVRGHVAISIQNLAYVASVKGDPRLSARLLGYATKALERHEFTSEYTEQTTNDRLRERLRQALNADELAQLFKDGEGLTEDQAVEEAQKI